MDGCGQRDLRYVGRMFYDISLDRSATARMLLALCFLELLSDGSQLLSGYNDIQEVDDWHHGEFFSS